MKSMKKVAGKPAVLIVIWMFLVLLGGSFCGAEEIFPTYPETVGTAREVLWKTLASGGVNAATVAVMDQGKIIYSEGFGAADRRKGRRVDPETRFNIGSTSKMFVAVAIMLLRDEGKLSLDDPVVRHLPEFTMRDPRHKDITIRMLFNHSSGLPGSTFEFEFAPQGDPHALLLEVLSEENLKHDPGVRSIYCNDGFTLAEMVVEHLSGKSFLEFLKERIFEPLEMRHTGASVGEEPGKVAFFYDTPEGKKYPLERVSVYGAGGLSSTAEDLCRFGDSFMPGGNQILSDASLKEILALQPTPFSKALKGEAILDSFGWDYAFLPAYEDLGYQVLAKSGGTMFYSTNLQILPAERIAVAVSLSGRASGEAITRDILDALMREKGLPAPEKESAQKPAEPREIPEELLSFGGVYVSGEQAFRLDFEQEEGLLKVYTVLPPPSEEEKGSPVLVFIHQDGLFYDAHNNQSYYFLDREGERYLVAQRIPLYGFDAPKLQKIEKLDNPISFGEEIKDTLWLRRNALPMTQIEGELVMVLSSFNPELPGYVHFLNPLCMETPEFGAIAATAFRDQMSLHLSSTGEGLLARLGMCLFSPESVAGELSIGKNSIIIGPEGENEWGRLSQGGLVSFQKPEKGRVMVFSEKAGDVTCLYDSLVDEGERYFSEKSFIFTAGAPGEIFEVSLR